MAWRVHLETLARFGQSGYRLFIGQEYPNGETHALTSATMRVVQAGEFIGPESALLDDSFVSKENVRDFLQAMSDAAWEIGIKPKQIEDHSNELRATKYHLEDMRKLSLTMALGDNGEKNIDPIGDRLAAAYPESQPGFER